MSISEADNKRVASRKRVLKTAKIYRMNGSHAMDAQVRDMSDTGARIVCKDHMALPNEFKFVLAQDGFMHMAKVAWRRGELAGIEFTSEKTAAQSPRMQNSNIIQGR